MMIFSGGMMIFSPPTKGSFMLASPSLMESLGGHPLFIKWSQRTRLSHR